MSEFTAEFYATCADIAYGRTGWFTTKNHRKAVNELIEEYNSKINQCRALQDKLKAVKPTASLEASLKAKQEEAQALAQSNKKLSDDLFTRENQLGELALKYKALTEELRDALTSHKSDLEARLKDTEEIQSLSESVEQLAENILRKEAKLNESAHEFMTEQAKRLDAEERLSAVSQMLLAKEEELATAGNELEQAQLVACKATAEAQELALKAVTAEGELEEARLFANKLIAKEKDLRQAINEVVHVNLQEVANSLFQLAKPTPTE